MFILVRRSVNVYSEICILENLENNYTYSKEKNTPTPPLPQESFDFHQPHTQAHTLEWLNSSSMCTMTGEEGEALSRVEERKKTRKEEE